MDVQIEKKKGLKGKHIVYLLAGILLAFAIYKFIGNTSETTFSTDKSSLRIVKIKNAEFEDYINANGFVAPISTIFMDAYEGGRVKEKLVEEGATVKKGDIILKLENQGLYEQILASENNLALKQNDLRSTKLAFDERLIGGRKELVTSKYKLKQLKRIFEQKESLFNDSVIAKDEYLLAKEDYELAKELFDIVKLQTEQDNKLRTTSFAELDADLARMRKTLSMVYGRIDHLNVRATADGQLGFLDAEIGQNFERGQRIGQINVLTDYKIEASVDEHYIDRIKRDLKAELTRNNEVYPLRVRKVYPEVRNGKFQVDLVFIGDKPETIRTGQNYKFNLKLGEPKQSILLPKGGFFQTTGGQWVFVVDANGEVATKREIKLGRQNSKYYEVLEGLYEGDQVITSSYSSFGNATQIRLK
jgi:HlyD family secretion protein